MQKIIFIVCICLLMFKIGHGQNFDNFVEVENITLRLYNEQKWDSLHNVSEISIKNGIDYYYLRMRAGIAYYELKQYRLATYHFEKAVLFNKFDEIALEYLYFSYIFTGKQHKAKALTKSFSANMIQRLEIKENKLFEEVYLEGGPSLGKNTEKQGKQQSHKDYLLKEEELTNDVNYFAFGLKHNLTKNIHVFHSVSSIDIGKTQILNFYEGKISNTYRIYQRQYYINAGIYLGKGFLITPAFHYIDVNYDKLSFTNENDKLYLYQDSIRMSDFATNLTINKDFKKIDVALFATYASLNNQTIWQGGLNATYFPLPKDDFFIHTNLTWQKSYLGNRFIIEPIIGYKINSRIFIKGNYTFGQISNFVEKNAYVVYNINDNILSRKGLSINIIANKHIQFSLIYQHLTKENKMNFINNKQELLVFKTNNFINHSIIGGIKWTL